MKRIIVGIFLFVASVASLPGADIFWFVRYGQSLSVGSVGYCSTGGFPTCSSGASYGSLTIFAPNSLYPPADTVFRTLSGHVYQGSPPALESSATSMCNQYNVLSGRICATSDYGWPGASYAQLAKTATCTSPSCYFDNAIGNGAAPANTGVIQAKALGLAGGNTVYVPAVYYNQGEAEMNGSTTATDYEGYMVQLQADFESSINSAIGQTGKIPLVIVQKSSWTAWQNTRATPTSTVATDGIPIGQLNACLDHYTDGTIFCAAPDYAYEYGVDGVHRPQPGYSTQGGVEGAILKKLTVDRVGHRPFYPKNVTLASNKVDVQFWTPVGALAFNTTLVSALPDGNMGFEFTDTGGSGVTLPNSSVALKTSDTVELTLSGVPSGTFELRYAWTGPNGACPVGTCGTVGINYSGPNNGPRGNVADSATTDWNGDPLTNFALTFRIPGISAASPYSWSPPDPNLSTIPGPLPAPGVSLGGKVSVNGKSLVR